MNPTQRQTRITETHGSQHRPAATTSPNQAPLDACLQAYRDWAAQQLMLASLSQHRGLAE